MKMSKFFEDPSANRVDIQTPGPTAEGAWIPRIGETFPDLWADSTHGELEQHRWASGHYTVFFVHPSAYTPTSEIDVIDMARHQTEFDIRGCRVLGMTQSDPLTERMWIEEISAKHEVEVNFPIISDEDERIAQALGMNQHSAHSDVPICKTFIISPDLRISSIMEFPVVVPRSAMELVRIVDALQAARR